ncbi:MAG: BlaI/MecI/CopY family transcriptional regulator [Planctomycetes bacterium]|nr:BlaI/MecI/CopY family transcriptional regulator [Planctomycetota bacterium]
MKKKINITETEWPIMQVLWDRPSATSAVIIDQVTNERDISLRTVKALINRLMTKGAITYTKDEFDSRIYHYRAAVALEDVVREKNRSFISMIYDNDPMKLLTRFVHDAALSENDIDELRALLDKKQKQVDKE